MRMNWITHDGILFTSLYYDYLVELKHNGASDRWEFNVKNKTVGSIIRCGSAKSKSNAQNKAKVEVCKIVAQDGHSESKWKKWKKPEPVDDVEEDSEPKKFRSNPRKNLRCALWYINQVGTVEEARRVFEIAAGSIIAAEKESERCSESKHQKT